MSSVRDGRSVYEQVQAGPEFQELRSRLRRWVFPMTAVFLTWYLSYVVLASWAPQFMATRVSGSITVGLLVGLGQFVSTFVITTFYVRFAAREVDPAAARLRARVERSAR